MEVNKAVVFSIYYYDLIAHLDIECVVSNED